MTTKRANMGDLGRAFERIRREATAAYPEVLRTRRRLAVLAHLHVLADEIAAALEIFEKLKEPDLPSYTPPGLKADKAIAVLRDYRLELLGMLQKAGRIAEGDAEIARLRERLCREPAPGLELVDACKLLIWYLQLDLFMQTQAEAATTTCLLSEDEESHVYESARLAIPQARQDPTLARLVLQVAEGDYDGKEVGRIRKRVERRRRPINEFLGAVATDFETMARDYYQGILRGLPGDSGEAREVRKILDHLDDPMNPTTRHLMKQWLTVNMLLDARALRKPLPRRKPRAEPSVAAVADAAAAVPESRPPGSRRRACRRRTPSANG